MAIQVEERSMKWLAVGTLIAINSVYSVATAAEHRAASSVEVAALSAKLQPGDVVILASGAWNDQAIVFFGKGIAEKPITFRAETPGKVILTGSSSIVIDGEHLVVSGLCVKDGTGAGDGIAIKGRHCRLTETAVIGGTYKFFVHLFGIENRMDHCYLAEKTSESPTLQVEAPAEPNRHRIDHNLFGHRPPLGRNGGESMRVGYSHQSMNNSGTVVEDNLFDRCDGEIEIISSKSCENIYRRNTFLDCAGMLTLRHGNRCTVEGNFFIAHHKRGSGGIRIIGEDHTIVNNYIDGVDKGAFWITSGIPDSPLKGYFRARGCAIAFNTVVDSAGPYLDLSAGFGTSNRSLRPENITIANNVFAGRWTPPEVIVPPVTIPPVTIPPVTVPPVKVPPVEVPAVKIPPVIVPAVEAPKEEARPAKAPRRAAQETGSLLSGVEGSGFKWIGNFAGEAGLLSNKHQGIQLINLKLERFGDGVWRPMADSPVRGAAEGEFPAVKIDIDGQSRKGRFDAGCDQQSNDPVTSRPLTTADVGPEWMKSK
jgi:poly(beta-D-mannuronate) lyase